MGDAKRRKQLDSGFGQPWETVDLSRDDAHSLFADEAKLSAASPVDTVNALLVSLGMRVQRRGETYRLHPDDRRIARRALSITESASGNPVPRCDSFAQYPPPHAVPGCEG